MTRVHRERHAARVILLDQDNRVLVLKAHDGDNPLRQWWFTVGGGIEGDETSRQAAARELFEETGISVAAEKLQGPVLQRTALFDFEREDVLQHEEFYYFKLAGSHTITKDGWTEVERDFVDDIAWLTQEELANQPIEVFPEDLANIVGKLAKGWDGTLQRLGHQTLGK